MGGAVLHGAPPGSRSSLSAECKAPGASKDAPQPEATHLVSVTATSPGSSEAPAPDSILGTSARVLAPDCADQVVAGAIAAADGCAAGLEGEAAAATAAEQQQPQPPQEGSAHEPDGSLLAHDAEDAVGVPAAAEEAAALGAKTGGLAAVPEGDGAGGAGVASGLRPEDVHTQAGAGHAQPPLPLASMTRVKGQVAAQAEEARALQAGAAVF